VLLEGTPDGFTGIEFGRISRQEGARGQKMSLGEEEREREERRQTNK
jgi:hypothetical protein